MNPLWYCIILISGLAICAGIYREMVESRLPRPKVLPLSDDDLALQAHYLRAEELRQAQARYAREATRRHYEFITWPAIQWEDRRRQIEASQESARLARHMENLRRTA